MGVNSLSVQWRAVGKRVRGVSHVQSGKPCQDAVDWWEQEGVAALVVADGHGSDRSPRSDVGAAFAVDVALNALRSLHANSDLALANLRALKHLADEQLPRLLVRDWRDRVLAHHAATVATTPTTLPEGAEGAVPTDPAGPADEPVSGLGVPAASADARRPCADAAQEPDLTPGMRLSSNPAGLRSFALPTVPGCVAEGRVRLPPNRSSSAPPPAPEAGDVLVQRMRLSGSFALPTVPGCVAEGRVRLPPNRSSSAPPPAPGAGDVLVQGMRLSGSFALPTVPGCVAEGRVRLPPNRSSSASPPAPEAGGVLVQGMRLSGSFALPTVPGCVAEGRVRLPPNRSSSGSPPAPEAGDVLVQYGSTLLTVLAGPEVLLFLQLGDGDILVVADDGTVTRPMPEDSRLMANETTSLCTVDAWREIRVALYPLVEGAPALILLATDGYANSFVSEQDFLRVGPDYLQAIREEGLAAVASRLDEWLADASTQGSGDDITLGIVARSDVAEGAEHALREGAPS